MPITPPMPQSRLSLVKGFAGIFMSLLLMLGIVGSMHYYTYYTTERSNREASESLNVDLARRMIVSDISSVASDLMFLARHVEQQGLLQAPRHVLEQRVALEFSVFAEEKRLFDQIRYLDRAGREVVRVNYNGGQLRTVPRDELQNKADRYYIQDVMSQSRGGLYLSPLDLNIEDGKIEYPLKPMIRFATPVFDDAGVKQGAIMLNYFGDRLIGNFTQAAANIADHVVLVNEQGYWLKSLNRKDEWGFMFGSDKTFATEQPRAWDIIQRSESGQFQTSAGLFTFHTVSPLSVARQTSQPGSPAVQGNPPGHWKIIAQVSSRELSATLPFFIQQHLALYLGMLGLIIISALFLAHSQYHHRRTDAQREYEQRFRHTLENIELVAVALDRQGLITFCNDYFLRLTDWKRKDVIGKAWIETFIPDEFKADMLGIIDRMRHPEQFPPRYEGRVLARDGSLLLIAWNNTLSYNPAGAVIGVTGIGEDITEQRRSEEELRKLNRAVEQSPSVVMITNRQGLIDYVNPKFTEVSGYTREEVVGRNPRILKSGETSKAEYKNLWATVYRGEEWRGEFHNRRKSGELYWESATISAIRNPEGEITHFLAVKEDITEHKRLEAEVEERNRELSKNQALAAMGRMASMIAHDLRNPLSSVKMTLQILGKQNGDQALAETDELRQISLEQIRYMEEILSDMLTYSKPDALNPEWITIDRVIDMAIGLSQRKIEEFDVQVSTQYHPGLPTLYGDATKLRQVFSNLITNAAQSTDGIHRPRVAIDVMVELGLSGTCIRVDICDNGNGIDPEERERLFEPFFTTRTKGTGLGLAIVKRILDQHRAAIELLPNEPQGTRVSVVLPISPNSIQQDEEQSAENSPA
ncbi:PAS domain S-box protein [Sedimenticola hydrogenitrophicus]|uniref:PAS domain S-box protein n=1 Tax=Sedimenticola hydrogenitrophicus TaxID=2967975 RepID=UPI0023AF4600|nr:PAS domain S-box protein [Sedimenticola hydrogenitrophicus]